MQVILKKVAPQDINGVIGGLKTEAARRAVWSGFKAGAFVTGIVAVLIGMMLVGTGRLNLDSRAAPQPGTGPIGVPGLPPAGGSPADLKAGSVPLGLPPTPAPDQP